MSKTASRAAALLGAMRSERKSRSSRENAKLGLRPHVKKLARFEKEFPHPLICNEYQIKWPLRGMGTYNPDYYCEKLGCFIEVTTSLPNISAQSPKWRRALKDGRNLRVYWWEGNEITNRLDESPSSMIKPR